MVFVCLIARQQGDVDYLFNWCYFKTNKECLEAKGFLKEKGDELKCSSKPALTGKIRYEPFEKKKIPEKI